jgi:hypothetical protein
MLSLQKRSGNRFKERNLVLKVTLVVEPSVDAIKSDYFKNFRLRFTQQNFNNNFRLRFTPHNFSCDDDDEDDVSMRTLVVDLPKSLLRLDGRNGLSESLIAGLAVTVCKVFFASLFY